MLGVESFELGTEEYELLRHPIVGGVILFTRNYESPRQLQALTASIHAVRRPALLVAVDHEGGRVQRFRSGFTPLPAVRRLGEIYDRDRRAARRLAQVSGWLMAVELRAVGVDFSCAPVLDVASEVSTVIGDRGFHPEPLVVAELAHAYMRGMAQAGMAAVGKHFPGHGSVAADSHHEVPRDNRSYVDIASADMAAFERMIRYGVTGLMATHVIYPNIDTAPAGFSPTWLRGILRRRLGFSGAILSDDLGMAGAAWAGDAVMRAQIALAAGCDMVLACNERAAAVAILERLEHGAVDPVSSARLARLRGTAAIDWTALSADERWRQASSAVQSYA